MARKWSNEGLPGVLHFVTGNVLDRRPIFRHPENCRIFLRALQRLRVEEDCKIVSFVLMPDHFHLVANPRGGNIRNSMGNLKSKTAKAIIQRSPMDTYAVGGRNQVWQESFKALPLWSSWMIEQKINYIHANPIRAGLCDATEEYPWSSFHDLYRDNRDPLLKVDKWWWWDGEEELRESSARGWEQRRMEAMQERISKNAEKNKL